MARLPTTISCRKVGSGKGRPFRLVPVIDNPMIESKVFNSSTVADGIAEMDFANLGEFNTGGAGVFWSEAGVTSPREMHPDTEELLQILEGEIEAELLPLSKGAGQKFVLAAWCCLIVPKGCWHRQTINKRSKEFYLTPGETQHSHAEDPRVE
jgi:oxalate decarboxylase/phosphoglucose isomerase-like protein (cupin superfamily)